MINIAMQMIKNIAKWFFHAGGYTRGRLMEKSTLVGIVTAIGADAGIATPFCYPIILVGVMAVMVPNDLADKIV